MIRSALLLAAAAGWAAGQQAGCSPKIASSSDDIHLNTGCSGDGAVLIQTRDTAGAVAATHNLTDLAAVQLPAATNNISALSTSVAAGSAATASLRAQLAAAVAAAAGLRNEVMVNVSRIDATTARVESYARTTLGQQSTAIRSVQTSLTATQSTVTAIRTCNAGGRILGSDGRTCTYAHAMRCGTPSLISRDRTRRYTYDGTQPNLLVGSSYTGLCNTNTYGAAVRSYCNFDGTWSVNSAPTGTSACRAHTLCSAGQYVRTLATPTSNTVCATCPSGYIQLASNFNGTSCRAPGAIQGRSCSASSQYNSCYRCQNAYNNNWNDGCNAAWATRGQGAGSWYRMYFNRAFVTRIRFRQRNCACEWYRRIQITFSNGVRRTVNLARTQDQTVTFAGVGPVTYAHMVFDQVWGRVNNGANEIQFQGVYM